MIHSLAKQDMALSSLFLAAKLEEHALRLRDLINVFHYIGKCVEHEKASLALETAKAKARSITAQTPPPADPPSTGRPMQYTPMDYFDKLFYDMKEQAVIGEMQILKRCASRHSYRDLYDMRLMRSSHNAQAGVQLDYQTSLWTPGQLSSSPRPCESSLSATASMGLCQ